MHFSRIALWIKLYCGCRLNITRFIYDLQVIIAGPSGAAETHALLVAAHSTFAPDKLVIPVDPSNKGCMEWYKQHNPLVLEMVEGASQKVNLALSCSMMLSMPSARLALQHMHGGPVSILLLPCNMSLCVAILLSITQPDLAESDLQVPLLA